MIFSSFIFLFISFGFSLFEKISAPKNYITFLTNHIKIEKASLFFWWFLVITNSITCFILFLGIFQTILKIHFFNLELVFISNSAMILILLLGQRLAKDFQGAANLGIYFLINIFSWYLGRLS